MRSRLFGLAIRACACACVSVWSVQAVIDGWFICGLGRSLIVVVVDRFELPGSQRARTFCADRFVRVYVFTFIHLQQGASRRNKVERSRDGVRVRVMWMLQIKRKGSGRARKQKSAEWITFADDATQRQQLTRALLSYITPCVGYVCVCVVAGIWHTPTRYPKRARRVLELKSG
jgi:hypothetical protein